VATYKNETEETFVFPSLGLTVAPGDTFDTDADITTAGVNVSGKPSKKADAPVVAPAPVDAPAPDSTPTTSEVSK
jgi:hypothetical protein